MRLIPRIHLNTAIILMFVVGGLYWLNALSNNLTFQIHPGYKPDPRFCSMPTVYDCLSYGWPLNAVHIRFLAKTVHSVNYSNLAIDILVASAILALTAFLSEYLTARLTRPRQRA